MIKTLAAQIKQYRLVSALTPLWMVGEVVCEMIIPVFMGMIVDKGIYGGDLHYIYSMGGKMIVVALFGFLFGVLGGVCGAKASTGFAKNLRKAMDDNIQTFSFANIDKFSPSSLVTRLTTDVTNLQNAYQMILRMAVRAPMSMIVAMAMSFVLSPRLASVYLIAVVILGTIIFLLMRSTTKYFKQIFEKYDLMNESVQENVSAIRVVKAYVREDHEISKFKKASANIYLMFLRAELRPRS